MGVTNEIDEIGWQFYVDAAEASFVLGDRSGATELLGRAAGVADLFAADDARLPATLNRLAVLACNERRYGDAEELLKRALGIVEGSPKPDESQQATILYNLGFVQEWLQKADLAKELYERALGLEKLNGMTALVLDRLAAIYSAQGHSAASMSALLKALALRKASPEPDDWSLAITLRNLAELYMKEGRFLDAETALWRSIDVKRKRLGTDHPGLAREYAIAAYVYTQKRSFQQAGQLADNLVEVVVRALGNEHRPIADAIVDLTAIYSAQSRLDAARSLWAVTEHILRTAGKAPRKERAETLRYYAEILRALYYCESKTP